MVIIWKLIILKVLQCSPLITVSYNRILRVCCNLWILGVFPPDYVQHGPGPRYSYKWWKHCKIPTNKMQHQNESVPIVKHQSRSGKKGRKLSGIFQSRVNSMGNLSLAINFSHCCSKDWVKAQKAISFYLFNLFPFFDVL